MPSPGLGTQPFATSSMGGARNITITVSGPRTRTLTVVAVRTS